MSDPSPTAGDDSWFCAGPVSSFPDIASSASSTPHQKVKLSASVSCEHNETSTTATGTPAARIFRVSKTTSSAQPIELTEDEALGSVGLEEQVLVFQYRGKFHAVDHQCPHRSYPLARGTVYDIEDFGIVFSAGITCPKHGWAFDLHTGESDRGTYKLRVWPVEVRERMGKSVKEVWVKKR